MNNVCSLNVKRESPHEEGINYFVLLNMSYTPRQTIVTIFIRAAKWHEIKGKVLNKLFRSPTNKQKT